MVAFLAGYITATTIFADGGLMHMRPGLSREHSSGSEVLQLETRPIMTNASPARPKPEDGATLAAGANRLTGYVILTALIAAIGGLLFGFDTGVISGAILFIQKDFALSPGAEEFVTSAVLIGATAGALLGGVTASGLGRRWSIILAAAAFVLGTLVASLANGVPLLIAGRILVGVAIGIASFMVPMYISEMAPPRFRGAMTSLNQLALVTGILLAYLVDYLFTASANWRAMFGFGVIPSALLLVGMFFMPSSPRWLIFKGRVDEARSVLVKIRGSSVVAAEIADTQASLTSQQSAGYGALRQPLLRLPLTIGIGLAILQQVTGINTVIYYAPTIFQMAGVGSAAVSIAATAGVGLINLLATIVAAFLVDRLGRRRLLLISLAGMAAALAVLAVAFFIRGDVHGGSGDLLGIITVISLMVYVAAFAIGLGPVFWLLIAEIYPLNVRSPAMSLAALANWGANWVVAATFLSLITWLSAGGTFLLFAVISVFAWFFVQRLVFETRGKSLEAIEREFAAREHIAFP